MKKIAFLLLTALTVCGIMSGRLDWQYYPQRTAPPFSLQYAGTAAAYALLALLPAICEGKETLTWHYLRQNI